MDFRHFDEKENTTLYTIPLQSFLNTKQISSYETNTQILLKEFISILIQLDFELVVKTRKNNSFTLALANSPNKNVCIIYPYKKHVRVIVKDILDKKIYSSKDLDQELFVSIDKKASLLYASKKQLSIYMHTNLYDRITSVARHNKEKVNDLIINSLKGQFNIYLDDYHYTHFGVLLVSYPKDNISFRTVAILYILSSYVELYNFTCQHWEHLFDRKFAYKVDNYLSQEKLIVLYRFAISVFHDPLQILINGTFSRLNDFQDISLVIKSIRIAEGVLDYEDKIFQKLNEDKINKTTIHIDKIAIKSILEGTY